MSLEYKFGDRITVDIDSRKYYYGEQIVDDLEDVADVAEAFNELLAQIENKEPSTIEDYYNEWEQSITELQEKELQLINIKETYTQLEQEIIDNTDFKELYGANNQKVRDNHVKNELKDLVDTKHELDLRMDYLKRRIEFIKSLMSMQGALIKAGVNE